MGRFIRPLYFEENGAKVEVRRVSDLKRFFNEEHLEKLILYLKDGSLARFFYGLGRDELKDLIEIRNEEGASGISILNEIAGIIGVPGFNVDWTVFEEFIVFKPGDRLGNLLSKRSKVVLATGKWETADEENIGISGSSVIEGAGTDKTLLLFDKINLSGDGELTLSNLVIASRNGVGLINVYESSRVNFRNVFFKDVAVNAYGAGLSFSNCRFENAPISEGETDFNVIKAENSNIVIKDSHIKGGNYILLKGSTFRADNSNIQSLNCGGITALDSSLIQLSNCELFGNGNMDNNDDDKLSQLNIVNSRAEIWRSKIYDGIKSGGISVISSEVSLKESMVYGNYYRGVNVNENSNIHIENCDVYGNGNEKNSHPQLMVENSRAEIVGSKIRDGVKNTGLRIYSSEVSLKECTVSGNYYNGINVKKNSNVHIENCDVYGNGNGNGEDSYPQLRVENSRVEIVGSKIRDGVENIGLGINSSEVSLKGCTVSGNYYGGIDVTENSNVHIENCDVYGNGNKKNSYPQLWVENSRVEIVGSKIRDGVENTGLRINSSEVSLKGCTVSGNYYNGINVNKNSKIYIENCDVYGNGNEESDYPQLYVENSRAEILGSKIRDGVENTGLRINSSEVSLKGCTVSENYYNGISVEENSNIHIENCDVYGNWDDQLYVSNSRVEIVGSKIRDGVIGLYIENSSEVSLKECTVSGNYWHGISFYANSNIHIENCDVYGNGNEISSYSQLYVSNSRVEIVGSKIRDGVKNTGLYIENSSEVSLKGCTVSGNYRHGISFYANSNIHIENCDVYGNGDDQLYVSNSRVEILGSKIHNGVNNYGIYFKSGKLVLKSVTTWGNKKGLYYESDSYEKINCNFQDGVQDGVESSVKSSDKSLCFITTATLTALGKDDSCEELGYFRMFRDTWLINQPDGKTLVEEYYRIAPSIVSAISKNPHQEMIYYSIWKVYLEPALEAIRQGAYPEAKRIYVAMVNTLKKHFLHRGNSV